MKHIAALLLPMILFSGCLAAEEAEKQLPKEMEPIVAELNSAKADATAKAIKKLQKVQVDLTKKGDLDGAMAAKKYIENLQKSLAFSVQGNGASDLPIVVLGEWGGEKRHERQLHIQLRWQHLLGKTRGALQRDMEDIEE